MKKVAIVIPYYKTNTTRDEEISMRHLNRFLKNYDKFLIIPSDMKKVLLKIPKAKIRSFPAEFFTSREKYSELVNSKNFYQQFLDYEYILIYQHDALVFSDQLTKWCNQGYDYIGAPFFNPVVGKLSYCTGNPISGGNGGFSLRKVSSFLKVIDLAESQTSRTSTNPNMRKLWFLKAVLANKSHKIWLNAPPKDYPFNEDGFWSYEAPKYYPKFKVAPFKEALKFSFERFPRKCFELNGGRIPFGTHAWKKCDEQFWEPYILK